MNGEEKRDGMAKGICPTISRRIQALTILHCPMVLYFDGLPDWTEKKEEDENGNVRLKILMQTKNGGKRRN